VMISLFIPAFSLGRFGGLLGRYVLPPAHAATGGYDDLIVILGKSGSDDGRDAFGSVVHYVDRLFDLIVATLSLVVNRPCVELSRVRGPSGRAPS